LSQQVINVGAVGGDRTGDLWRDSMIKANANFTEIYSISIILTNKADVLANGTTVAGVTTLNVDTYIILGNIDMLTDRIVATGGTLITGNTSGSSSITTNSSLPTITFNAGGFVSNTSTRYPPFSNYRAGCIIDD